MFVDCHVQYECVQYYIPLIKNLLSNPSLDKAAKSQTHCLIRSRIQNNLTQSDNSSNKVRILNTNTVDRRG